MSVKNNERSVMANKHLGPATIEQTVEYLGPSAVVEGTLAFRGPGREGLLACLAPETLDGMQVDPTEVLQPAHTYYAGVALGGALAQISIPKVGVVRSTHEWFN